MNKIVYAHGALKKFLNARDSGIATNAEMLRLRALAEAEISPATARVRKRPGSQTRAERVEEARLFKRAAARAIGSNHVA